MSKRPFVKSLTGTKRFIRLLGDVAHRKNFRAGFVVIKQGDSVGGHSTANKEEALIILQGRARIACGRKELTANKNTFVYIPPRTHHDVKNIGKKMLKYVYITSKKD